MFLLPFKVMSASENMAQDFLMLTSWSVQNSPRLRFYGWTNFCATFGRGQSIDDFSHDELSSLTKAVRRPVGGGLVLHNLSDITYALVVPQNCDFFNMRPALSYALLHENIALALSDFGGKFELLAKDAARVDSPAQCFKFPTANDVVSPEFGKVAGAAQRRTRAGLLVQGSIRLNVDQFNCSQEIRSRISKNFSRMLDSSLELISDDIFSMKQICQTAKMFKEEFVTS